MSPRKPWVTQSVQTCMLRYRANCYFYSGLIKYFANSLWLLMPRQTFSICYRVTVHTRTCIQEYTISKTEWIWPIIISIPWRSGTTIFPKLFIFFKTTGDKQAKRFSNYCFWYSQNHPPSDASDIILNSPASQSPQCPWGTPCYCTSRTNSFLIYKQISQELRRLCVLTRGRIPFPSIIVRPVGGAPFLRHILPLWFFVNTNLE